ncbi:MAG: hypothetical protein RPU34_10995, partial [Candidatus Sedimenticola sp. (ex Thyasira tokunagai)]
MSTLDGPLSTTRYFGILFGQHPDNMETQLIDFINTNAGSIPAAPTTERPSVHIRPFLLCDSCLDTWHSERRFNLRHEQSARLSTTPQVTPQVEQLLNQIVAMGQLQRLQPPVINHQQVLTTIDPLPEPAKCPDLF